jgi:hypothetical protein
MILKKNNIAEYILYLWQIEDYLRAFPQQADANQELHDISEMMHQENILKSGHLQLAQNALAELEDLHNDLLDQEATYRAAVIQLAPSLNILKSKTNRPTMSDIEACLVLLYQIMLLKLQKKPISTETEQVQKQVTKLLQYLSKTYKEQ